MTTEATMPRTTPRRARLMTTLFAAQVCGSTGHSIGMAIGGIMAAAITGTNTWSGMPVAVGALRTPARAGAGLRARGARRARGDGRRDDAQLRAPARRHGALRRLADLEPARALRRRRRELQRSARAGDGTHRLGLERRIDRGSELDGARVAAQPLVRGGAGGERLPDQRRRLRRGGGPRRAVPAPR